MQYKSEIYIDPSFKPLSLNVRKAMEIVKKFEMIWPSVDNKHQLQVAHFEPQSQEPFGKLPPLDKARLTRRASLSSLGS